MPGNVLCDAVFEEVVICGPAIIVHQTQPLQSPFLIVLEVAQPRRSILEEAQRRVERLLLTKPNLQMTCDACEPGVKFCHHVKRQRFAHGTDMVSNTDAH